MIGLFSPVQQRAPQRQKSNYFFNDHEHLVKSHLMTCFFLTCGENLEWISFFPPEPPAVSMLVGVFI